MRLLQWLQARWRPPAPPLQYPMELRTFPAGSRAECCATCRLGNMAARTCPMIAEPLPDQLDAGNCAAWDLDPYRGLAQLLYLRIQAQRRGVRYG